MVGDQLTSCTVDLQYIVIANQIQGRGVRFKNLTNEHRIVIVDTPGFDDTTVSDSQILTRIADGLRESYVSPRQRVEDTRLTIVLGSKGR